MSVTGEMISAKVAHTVLHIPESDRIQDRTIHSEFDHHELYKKAPVYVGDAVLEHPITLKL